MSLLVSVLSRISFMMYIYEVLPSLWYQEVPTSLFILADGNITDWFGGLLYSAGQQANEAVLDQLSALSFTRHVFI